MQAPDDRVETRRAGPKRWRLLSAGYLAVLMLVWVGVRTPRSSDPGVIESTRSRERVGGAAGHVAPGRGAAVFDLAGAQSREKRSIAAPVPQAPGAQSSSRLDEAAEVRARWHTEPHDERWTRSVKDHLTSSMVDLQTEGQVLDVSCRATVCRAQLRFKDLVAAARYADEAADPGQRVWVTTTQAGGQFSVDVYAQRRTAGEQ